MAGDNTIGSGNNFDDLWAEVKQNSANNPDSTSNKVTNEQFIQALKRFKPQNPVQGNPERIYPGLELSTPAVKYGANIGCQADSAIVMKYGANIGSPGNTAPTMKYGANIGCQKINPNKIKPSGKIKPKYPDVKAGEYTVQKGMGYTALIKSALINQGINPTPYNIKKAKLFFELQNPNAVKIYKGADKSKRGNRYLLADATIKIPDFDKIKRKKPQQS